MKSAFHAPRLKKAHDRWRPIGVRRRARAATAAVLLLAAAFDAAAAPAVIDPSTRHQLIRGFGGVVGWRPPFTAEDVDTLFGHERADQLGLTLYRVRIAPDGNWTDETANAQKAAAYGAAIIATPWSPPAAMKTTNNVVGGSLKPESYGAYRDYLNRFVAHLRTQGVPLYAISLQNEPDWDPDYEGCVWTAQNFLSFCRDYAGAITGTRVIMPESLNFNHALSDPVLNDPVAAANVDIIGGHLYGGGLAPYPLAVAKGKEVWMTEHLELTTDWSGAMQTAREIHDCLAVADFSAYFWWYLKRYYGPLGEDGIVTKRGYVMAHYAKFIRPGYVRVAATATPTFGVFVSAYQGPRVVIVAINASTSDVSQEFTLQSTSVESFTTWLTSSSVSMAEQSTVNVSHGRFTALLPANSITTLVQDPPAGTPRFVEMPRPQTIAAGGVASLSVQLAAAPAGNQPPTLQWRRNGRSLSMATSTTYTLQGVTAGDTGLYDVLATNGARATVSAPAILGVAIAENVLGGAKEVASDITHANGNVYDQVLLTGTAATITADAQDAQVTRLSFIDLDDDIVQIELSGPGSLSVVLESATGPARPAKYQQGILYMKGHAGLVVTGATEQTNLAIFTVGRATAFDPSGGFNVARAVGAENDPRNNGSPLFSGHAVAEYDGIADLAYLAIQSADGKFGTVRSGNVNYFAAQGLTGLYAPRVTFLGRVLVGDVAAFDAAEPALLVGSAADVRITGGSLAQPNGRPLQIGGIRWLQFTAGSNSHGVELPLRANAAVLQREGIDVTDETLQSP